METIRNYLDSMFSSLPDTMEVRKAKDELYQMMEDKYFELKSEGKSENEAIGIVITEFGNLDEIKEELGIYYKEEASADAEEKYVSMNQAREYINMVKKYSNFIAIATMLCILSPINLIFLGGLTEISSFSENVAGFAGLMILFAFIIVAVILFIYSGRQMEEYEYLKKEVFRLDNSTEVYIREERKKNRSNFSIKIIVGVVLCIFSVVPLLCSAFFFNDFACICSVCILLIFVGIGVFFFITAGMVEDSYKILLQEGDYKKSNKSKGMETIATVYWCIVTAIYLGWSFWTMQWSITWIIWPVAGVLYGAIAAIYGAVRKNN